jgi:hypothetical protein
VANVRVQRVEKESRMAACMVLEIRRVAKDGRDVNRAFVEHGCRVLIRLRDVIVGHAPLR